mmetsp:Transcript_93022/g.299418  ORF Transcript_93022/g.299418 Transcript_93022/m.299418 type:complete len:315 (+) Transcript_93022:176-1120(+)
MRSSSSSRVSVVSGRSGGSHGGKPRTDLRKLAPRPRVDGVAWLGEGVARSNAYSPEVVAALRSRGGPIWDKNRTSGEEKEDEDRFVDAIGGSATRSSPSLSSLQTTGLAILSQSQQTSRPLSSSLGGDTSKVLLLDADKPAPAAVAAEKAAANAKSATAADSADKPSGAAHPGSIDKTHTTSSTAPAGLSTTGAAVPATSQKVMAPPDALTKLEIGVVASKAAPAPSAPAPPETPSAAGLASLEAAPAPSTPAPPAPPRAAVPASLEAAPAPSAPAPPAPQNAAGLASLEAAPAPSAPAPPSPPASVGPASLEA